MHILEKIYSGSYALNMFFCQAKLEMIYQRSKQKAGGQVVLMTAPANPFDARHLLKALFSRLPIRHRLSPFSGPASSDRPKVPPCQVARLLIGPANNPSYCSLTLSLSAVKSFF